MSDGTQAGSVGAVNMQGTLMTPLAEIQKTLQRLDALGRVPADVCPPLERRLEQGMAQIKLLRGWGLTWHQIALGLPSWTQKDGTAVTADQLRGSVSRISNKKTPQRSISKPSWAAVAVQTPPPTTQAQTVRNAPPPASSREQSSLLAQLALTRRSRKADND